MLTWRFWSGSGRAGAWGQGLGPLSPQGITMLSPAFTDMARAMSLCAIPPIEAAQEISLP